MSCDCLEKLEKAAIRANLRNHSGRWFEELTDIIQAARFNTGPYAAPAGADKNDFASNYYDYANAIEWAKWAKEHAKPALEDADARDEKCTSVTEALVAMPKDSP